MAERTPRDARKPIHPARLAALIATLAVVFVPPIVLMVADLPPASWLMDLQAGWFDGKYYPKATFLVLVLMEGAAVLAVVLVILLMSRIVRLLRG